LDSFDYYDVFYKAVLNGSNDAIGIFKYSNKTITFENYNDNFTKMPILNATNPKQKCIEELFDEKFVIEFRDKINECLNLKKCLKYTSTYISNGKEIYWNINLNPLFIDEKIILFVFFKDITKTILEHRKKDDLLSEYECLFEISRNPTCLLVFDENNTITLERKNKAFKNLKNLYKLHKPDFNYQDLFSKLIKQKEQLKGDFCIDLENGDRLHYDFTIIPIIKENKVIKAFVICMNTTEKLKLSKKTNVNLTKRENEVLELVVDGNTNKFIAFKLKITEGTVKKLLSNSYKKLGIHSRSELLKFYLTNNSTYTDN